MNNNVPPITTTTSPEAVLAKTAHDLRDDLATITNWAEILTTESCTEVRINGLTIIQDRAERMGAILNAIQDYLNTRQNIK